MRRTVRAGDGLDLAVVEFGGVGPPILLLHGLMGRASTWWPVARWLTEHGRPAARGRGPWTGWPAEVLEPLGPATVIGHPMVGLHGIALAARQPELVRALVVEGRGCGPPGPQRRRRPRLVRGPSVGLRIAGGGT